MSEKLKVVLDTQVFLRSVINPTSLSAQITPKNWRGYYTLFVSDATESELVDVLNRPQIRTRFPQITDQLVKETLTIIREEAERVELGEAVEPVSRDPKTTFSWHVPKLLRRIISSRKTTIYWFSNSITPPKS